MKTVKEEINRLFLESQKNPSIVANEAPYYYDLCSVEDKSISLDQFYKKFPYHNPDYNSEYWQKQYNRWKNLWKQSTI